MSRIAPPLFTGIPFPELAAWRADASLPDRLADAVAELRTGLPAIAHVHLAGAGASVALADAITTRGLPCTRDDDPFTAALAGAALLPGCACADVGHTGVKLAMGERTWRVRRDLARAPLPAQVAPADRAAARASTIAALAEAFATAGTPELVVALPCALSAAGLPRGGAYAWPDDDPTLLVDLGRAARAELAVLETAELAAIGAAADTPADRCSLVLSIGFAIRAALRRPS